jgi:N-acetyl-alpha-D-muramate 1-phosphate uridylyltransferase
MADSVAGPGSDRNATDEAELPDLAAVVLAAGLGERLRPISSVRPKPLCPVGGTALVDLALTRVRAVTDAVAVNLHDRAEQIADYLEAQVEGPRPHLSFEAPDALGTAGALGALRPWIDGRPVLVHNADVWTTAGLGEFVDGWDGKVARVLLAVRSTEAGSGQLGQGAFGPSVGLVATLLPWSEVEQLEPVPSSLYGATLRQAWTTGRLDAISVDAPFVDCGTPSDYLAANLAAAALAGGSIVDPTARVTGTIVDSVVGAGAVVEGSVVGSVLWDGVSVGASERLRGVVRVSDPDRDVQPGAG